MKKKVYKVMNLLLSGFVTMLGFNSAACSHEEPMDEYGVPYSRYRVMGTVTDENGMPIEGIKVKIIKGVEPYISELNETNTDSQGKYETDPFGDTSLDWDGRVAFVDVDGETNGAFENDTIDVKGLPTVQTEKSEGWFWGAYDITADRQLKEKHSND